MPRIRDLLRLSGRDRETFVQAAKMAVAAVAAWQIARQVHEPQSFIAPYAAVFMMGGTIFRSLRDAVLQVTTMVLGVLVAFVVAVTIPFAPLALAVAVFVGMVIGRWHRLGQDGIWVGVIALLMITYGTADDAGYLAFRVGEGVLGAVIGLAVNALVLPPLRLREGDRAVTAAAKEIADQLRRVAAGMRAGWSKQNAQHWHREAVAVERAVRAAEEADGDGRESARLNPRAALRGDGAAPKDSVLGALYEVAEQARHITKTLVTSDDPDNTTPRTGPVFDNAFAGLLEDLATALDAYREPEAQRRIDREPLRAALRRAREQRAALARQAPWPDHVPPEDWSAHAALLLAAERALLALLEA